MTGTRKRAFFFIESLDKITYCFSRQIIEDWRKFRKFTAVGGEVFGTASDCCNRHFFDYIRNYYFRKGT